MKNFIIIIIIAINIFSLVLNWKMLKGFDTPKKIKYLIIGELLTMFVTFLIYQIGSAGMDKRIVSASRGFVVSTFTGANSIIILSTFLKMLNRVQLGEVEEDEFKSKMTFYIIAAIIIIAFECFYVKNIELGIQRMEK